jgi:hypothetical protein
MVAYAYEFFYKNLTDRQNCFCKNLVNNNLENLKLIFMIEPICLDWGSIQIQIVDDTSVFITIGDWTVLMDNSNGERQITANMVFDGE